MPKLMLVCIIVCILGLYALATLPEWARGIQSFYIVAAIYLLAWSAALGGAIGAVCYSGQTAGTESSDKTNDKTRGLGAGRLYL